MNKKLQVTLFLLLLCSGTYARDFSINKLKLITTVPDNWKELRNVFGVPLVLVGPLINNRRTTISITPTSLSTKEFLLSNLKTYEKNYQMKKREHISSANGTLIEFFPYKEMKNASGESLHSLGVRYSIGKINTQDTMYYYSCNGSMLKIKVVSYDNQGAEIKNSIEEAIQSFKCL